ncbi:hypothetical protein [Streptomyces sp. NBC_00316]
MQAYGLTLVTPTEPPADPAGPPTCPGGTWAAGATYAAGDVVTYDSAS